jgi:RNA polymerase sigma-70 factor (ECF subfamily)
MFAIMRNAWLNQLRHARSGPRFVELSSEEEDHGEWLGHLAGDPHVLYLRKLEREEIRAAIDSLPHLYREIIVLRDIQGLSLEEVAGVLKVPIGTIKSRSNRARLELARVLAQMGIGREGAS